MTIVIATDSEDLFTASPCIVAHESTKLTGTRTGTKFVAAIGNCSAFRKGRDFAASLGIVPRQYSTGGKANWFGISKRGDVYLRKVLIHSARAAVPHIKRAEHRSKP